MISALFDDHYESFPLWREAGLSGLTCLHVDAHLDVSQEGFPPQVLAAIAAARTGQELSRFRGDPKLPWGGFHCGNFLFPALHDGTVTTLIWLLPPFILRGGSFLEGVLQELLTWVDLSFDEYRSFQAIDGRVEGVLLGRRLVVCTAGSLPPLSDLERARLVLDIDVDYFVRLRDDLIWQTPHELAAALGELRPLAVTVATSCDGGYTPASHRFLGQVCLDVFSGQPDRWKAELERLMEAQAGDAAALESFLEDAPPAWRPAVPGMPVGGQQAEAAAPDSTQTVVNSAARYLQKKEHARGLQVVARVPEDERDPTLTMAEAFLVAGGLAPAEAARRLDLLSRRPGLSELERGRIWRMRGEALASSGQAPAAVSLLRKLLRLEPRRADLLHLLARCQRDSGDAQAAEATLRKALKLAQGRMSSLPMLLDAARLYETLGMPALAREARQRLRHNDPTGSLTLELMASGRRPSRQLAVAGPADNARVAPEASDAARY
jgi:tetratricopeptide (TPR) repeat protein